MQTGMSVSWLMLAIAAAGVYVPPLAAQEREPYVIQGSVRDARSAAPLEGAIVTLRGTGRSARTDDEGRFTLSVSATAGTYELEYAAIGRRRTIQTITLGATRTMTMDPVALEQTAVMLDELVVSGVGAPAERRVLGNTIETVDGQSVRDAPGVSSVDQALQGKVTGAVISEFSGQPGGGISVRLRGTNSILGGAEPLWVVDGVIVDNSAEALVSLSANAPRGGAALSNRIADLNPEDIERIEVLKGAAAAALYGSRANNGVIQVFTRQGRAGDSQVRVSTEVGVSRTPNRLDLNMAPTAGQADVTFGGADAVGADVERFDIQDQLFRTGLATDNRISVSGGSGNTTYFFSGSYLNEEGIMESNDYERFSGRANVAHQVSDRLDLRVNASYTRSLAHFIPEGEQTQGVLTSVVFTPTVVNPAFDPDLGRYPYNPVLGANPLDVLANWEAPEEVVRFMGSVETSFYPVDNVTVRYLAGLDDYRQESSYFQPPQSTSASFTGSVQNPVRISRLFNNDLTVTHEAEATPSIGLTSTVGLRYTEDRTEVIRAAAEGLPPGGTLVGGATQFASQGVTEFHTVSGFAEERVSVQDRLYITGGINLDASSAFGPDERLQAFPRVSLSYLLGETDFWQNTFGTTVSSFRARAAYGQTGGQPPGIYARFDNYINVAYSGRAGLVASTLDGNDALKPERQREFELGFDAGLFDDRANVEFTYYDKKTTDLVLSVPQAPSRGVQSRFENIGELTNRGWELALSTVNIDEAGFSWRSRLQVAANRNEVTQLVTSADTLVVDYLNAVIENQPIGVFFGGTYARNSDGSIFYDDAGLPVRAVDTLPDGTTAFARRIIGDPNPGLVASLSNNFGIGRHVDISVLLDGRFGNDVANFTRRITEYFGSDAVIEREISGDTASGTFALNPNGRIQIYEEYIEDGSFVKLREVAVSFLLDQPFIRRILGMESARLRLAGRNLLTWTDYSGLDPEINLFSASTVSRGVDFANIPLPRTFTFGVTLTF